MALTSQRLAGAYAETMEEAEVCIPKREDVERLVREHPQVSLKMM